MRRVTPQGLDAIIRREGLRLDAYRDSAGLLTIGVGHLLARSELSSGKVMLGHDAVRWADGITEAQAKQLLDQDLVHAEMAVEVDGRALSDNQFDAAVSFCFNCGVQAYENSTLRRKILGGDLLGAADEFLRWDRAGGVRQAGLARRRQEERAQWLA